MHRGEVAVVTGGAGDIGREIVHRLRGRGAEVIAADLDGGDRRLDVASADAWATFAQDLAREHGRLDVLVNGAGIVGPTAALADYDPDVFDAVVGVNAKGTFLGMRAMSGLMRDTGGGAIVNLASRAGLMGTPGLAAYGAGKHAAVGLTRTAARELARLGIRVNAVCPGPVEGTMIESIERNTRPGDPARVRDAYLAAIPLGRYATPADVAAVVAFLSSPEAAYVTGVTIPVDGGMGA